MDQWLLAIVSALWLGVLTSISPCPMATNIAAISYVGRRVDHPRSVLWSGLLYTAGRILTYLFLGIILVSSLLSAPMISHMLQKYMNLFLGPLLILVGMILLGLISFNIGNSGLSGWFQKKSETLGIWGALLLGILFALSFCPTSAALFFGSLLPLALKQESSILLPGVYGLATGLPVLIFALLLATGSRKLGTFFNKITQIELWIRRITGALFIGIGIYYTLIYIFEIEF